MSLQVASPKAPAPWRLSPIRFAVPLTIVAGVFAVVVPIAGGGARPHAPDLALLAGMTPALKVHLGAVMAALALGAGLLLGPKGRTPHRVLGWVWSLFMVTAASSSLLIRELNHGAFSFLHIFSAWVLIAVPLAVGFARRHRAAAHGRLMSGLYVGGVLVAGSLAFLPGRLMWQVFFG
jgi:uncharacterized membrane protein